MNLLKKLVLWQTKLENKAFNKKEKEEPTILLNYLKQMKSENR